MGRRWTISGTIAEYYESVIDTTREAVFSLPEGKLLALDTDELATYYFSTYELPTIEKSGDPEWNKEPSARGWMSYETVVPVTIRYPIVLKERIEEVVRREASKTHLGAPPTELFDSYLVLNLQVTSSTNEQAVEQAIKNLEQRIAWKNEEVVQGNGRLLVEAKAIIETRKVRVTRETGLVEGLMQRVSIPLRKRPIEGVGTADLRIRKKIQVMMPSQRELQQVIIDRSKVMDVVAVIKNTGIWLSKTPKSFVGFDEERFRDFILAGLNMVFEGEATGETFNGRGKTDIRLRITKGDILVCECKLWEGPKYYSDGMDQLFGYLTWLEDYGIMISFSRQKDFAEVIEKAKQASTAHPSYVGESLEQIERIHFRTSHRFRDTKKSIEVHHLLFDISS